jgi:hypothetical protein
MKYKVKSQLYSDAEAQLKGGKQILDDCTWSSCAAAVSWASGYTVDYSAADGVAAMKKVTGRKDIQGKSDNGGSLPEAAKVIAHLGGKARYAKSWADAVAAAKGGAALQIWVQQGPAFYPAGVPISKWHDGWKRYWTKKDPKTVTAGYGHMVSSGYDSEENIWYFTCSTRDEKVAAEKYGVPVTEAQLRQIANSKSKAKKAGVDYKCILIVTHPGKVVAPAPVAAPVVAPVPAPVAAPVVAPAPTPAPAPRIVAEAPRSHAEPRKVAQGTKTPPSAVQAQLDQIGKADWGAIAADGLAVLNAAAAATGKEKGMNRIFAGLKYIAANTQIDEIALDFVKTFLTVSISVALGLGIPLLDIQGGDFRTIISAGLASGLGIVVKALDRDNSAYGLTKKN